MQLWGSVPKASTYFGFKKTHNFCYIQVKIKLDVYLLVPASREAVPE